MDAAPRRLSEPARGWAARCPDAPAVSAEGRHWTYRRLAEAIDAAAAELQARGVGPGDRVMLIGENGLGLAAFILACGERDACAVLENARRAPLEVDAIRRHCDPRCVIHLTEGSPDAAAHAQRHGAQAVPHALLGDFAWAAGAPAGEPDPVRGDADDTAVLIYTTGTTGTPKGVMLSHANLLYLSAQMVALRRVTPADRVYGVLPITHVMGLAGAFGGTLRAGAHLRLVPRFSAAACATALREDGITMLQGAPAMFAKLVDHAGGAPLPAPALRFIAAGGAPIDATVKADTEALFGLPLHNGYGLTEGSGLCWTRLDEPRADCSVGRALPGVELALSDADGRPVADGGVGELWARGPNVMQGYYRDPSLTARVTRPGGWFNTEDLARIDADGHVHIVGRTKDLIIAGGFNVYPLEVENALNAHPAIVHSAVVAGQADGSETVVAFVELAAGEQLRLAALKAFLAARIAPYKHPRAVYVLPQLPTSPNGKVLKQPLRRVAAEGGSGDARPLD
ncbi:class I adenylate-forming enzyme family protein [Piscinibacter sakaiensis]|uniref:Long-chain-fatty-acid--CoA ligase n=1 Tax=Piscinibacter sakaiensis TaxID=1547922 RepID=A0A0K8P5Z3_PISS1|nr:class I adenylate-forming enzyme family protein [Piscinibacter sakaiensis]GAP38006.1 long-chain-fatty-acid--CoA ligase [Piscinibacter sakaiensis]